MIPTQQEVLDARAKWQAAYAAKQMHGNHVTTVTEKKAWDHYKALEKERERRR